MNKSYLYDGKECSTEELKKLFLEEDKKEMDQRIVETLRMIEGKKILDVGCAAGNLSKKISEKGCYVIGIDVLSESIRIAKEFNCTQNTTFEIRDLLKEPFPEESFDCITFLETIEHVENPAQFLREFHRILKPDGCLILSTPNATSLKNMLYALSYRKKSKRRQVIDEIKIEQKNTGTQLEHIYNWDFPTLVRLLDRCGFDVIDHVFVRSGPIILPIPGRKIEIIKSNSTILSRWPSLMTGHVIKARKRLN